MARDLDTGTHSPPDNLADVAATLTYHLKMSGTYASLASKYNALGPAVLKNACLEAALIHVRLLIEFVAGRPDLSPKRTDALKRKWSNSDIRPTMLAPQWPGVRNKRLDGYLFLADKYVAHLSLERLARRDSGTTWALEDIVSATMSEFEAFAEAVETVHPSIADTIRVGINEGRRALTSAPGGVTGA